MPSFALSIVHTLADLICPERCAACTTLVVDGAIFCHGCRGLVNVLGPPECTACGAPATSDPCGRCRTTADRPVRSVRSWALYRTGGSREPVARTLGGFKYDGRTRLGRRMARMMATRVADPAVALILPMPLHPRRLRARGFNQSALLAHHLGRLLGVRVRYDALRRIRDTPSQTGAGVEERRARVAEAFRVADPPAVRKRTVLLIDDVVTSGATARAAARALRRAGARAVDVLTFARADLRVASPDDHEYAPDP